MKRLLAIGIAAGIVLTMGVTAYASGFKTPAEIYADLAGITVDQAYEKRDSGETFGNLAEEEGLFEAFHDQMIENREEWLQQRVQEGKITQEQADSIIDRMETCEDLGSGQGMMRGSGLFRGGGNGQGQGERTPRNNGGNGFGGFCGQ